MGTSAAFTSAGSIISVCEDAPATYNQVGFEALTFTEIGEVTDMGEFGKTYNVVTHMRIADRQVVKRKGSYNNGTMALQMARVPSDEGQAILVAAVDSDDSYSFKLELQDGSVLYFSAQVTSYPLGVGNVDSITAATVNVEIDNEIIEVAAAAS